MDANARRYACYMFTAMVLTLWYALSPSKETRIHVADPSFKQISGGDTRKSFKLALALEEGRTYHIEESTRHTATTRNALSFSKNAYEVLAVTEYLTTVSMDLTVTRVESGKIHCRATMVDFMGYEELRDEKDDKFLGDHNDEDDEDDENDDNEDKERKNRNREMFDKVREETRGVQFDVTLGSDGTVSELDTSQLRKKIITALHDSGQLPMHLEYAIVVGGYDVYPANGAAFGPQGRTNVKAPVVRIKGTGCDDKSPSLKSYKSKIIVLDRGDCTFNKKAQIAADHEAAAMIVVDQDYNEGAVMTYMSGEADVPIVSLIVNREAGKAIEDELRTKADFKELPNGDMTASDKYVVEILGGVEAVQALNEEDFEDEEDEDGTPHERKKLRSHHLNPVHSDGLHDFVGIGYVVDEVIRTRFSIFPRNPVSIGSSWERTLQLNDGIDPTVRAEISEKYKLVAMSRAEEDIADDVRKGDLIAEIQVSALERPAKADPTSKKEERLPINGDDDDSDDESTRITPQFARPSFKGHKFSTKGTLHVHVNTGFVLAGRSTSEASSQRTVVIINKRSKKKKTVKAKVDLVAETEYLGSFK